MNKSSGLQFLESDQDNEQIQGLLVPRMHQTHETTRNQVSFCLDLKTVDKQIEKIRSN